MTTRTGSPPDLDAAIRGRRDLHRAVERADSIRDLGEPFRHSHGVELYHQCVVLWRVIVAVVAPEPGCFGNDEIGRCLGRR